MRLILSLLLIVVFASTSVASSEGTFKKKKIIIVPVSHKTLAGYVYEFSDDFYYVKSVDRIFLQNEPVETEIIDVDIDDNIAEFELYNQKYGKGTLKLYSNHDLEDANDDIIDKALRNSVSNDVLSKVVLDISKKVVHLASCNHLPDKQNLEITEKNQAVKDGHTVCGICFAESQYLPDSGIEQSIQNKLSAELRHYNERLSDASLQAKVDTVGAQVLKHWPYPLINYQYGFSVVESNDINAFALPAGKIFLTSGLIRSLENDAELEAVMAHEIAHVERRHSLQTYREMISNQQAQMALQIIGGIAMGAAAASNHSNAAGVIGGVTLASMVAIQVKEIGFNIRQEKEADEYAVRYFRYNKKDISPLKSVFKKLMYNNLRVRNNPDPKNLTHPLLSNRLAEIDKRRTVFLKDTVYYSTHNDTPIEFKFYSVDTDNDISTIIFEVSDLDTFEGITAFENLELVNGSGNIKLHIENFFYTNPWGGIVTATTKSTDLNLTALTAYQFTISNRPNYRDSYPEIVKRSLTKASYY